MSLSIRREGERWDLIIVGVARKWSERKERKIRRVEEAIVRDLQC